MVEAFVQAGHSVSVFTRGQSPDPLPASVERLHGDRDKGTEGLTALNDRKWDVCVDVSGYTAIHVRSSAELLRDAVQQYIFVSTTAVYQSGEPYPVHEEHPLKQPCNEDVTEITMNTYGPLKVTCENIVTEIYGDRATLLRPQIVAGPYDPTGRHTWWVWRAQQGGEVAAPGDGTDYVQVVDARDIARFSVLAAENKLTGTFNMAGPRITWAEFMQALGTENPVWVSETLLENAQISSAQFPLYYPSGKSGSTVMNISSEHAQKAGFTQTSPAVTVADTKEWSLSQQYPNAITREQEATLIAQVREG